MGKQLAQRTGDKRFGDMWKFVDEKNVEVYLQRILDHSSTTKGYKFTDLEEKAKKGIPALMMTRTNPKAVGYEQVYDSRPWYTKTGRLEFYREEDEFIDAGENLPVHREPVVVAIGHGEASDDPVVPVGDPVDLAHIRQRLSEYRKSDAARGHRLGPRR